MTSFDDEEGSPQPLARTRRVPRLHPSTIEFEVPFHDVDALRVVWHGHYYKYMELARTELLRARKLDMQDLIDLRYGLVVIESACRHIAPLRYGDRVQVSAWFGDVAHRILIAYEFTNLSREGPRVARAHTALVTTTLQGEMLHRTPNAIAERLSPAGGFSGDSGAAAR